MSFTEGILRELRGEPAAPKPRPTLRPVAAETPEGVALYQCHVIVMDAHDVNGPHLCAKGLELRPYDPIPYHCDMPMALVGYNWGRSVADD